MAVPTDLTCYLNGAYIPHSEARVPIDDRGFLFSDGVYDVVKVYDGYPFTEAEHLDRLRRGLRELEITAGLPAVDELPAIARKLLEVNGLTHGDATVYIQITRGAAPRAHAFPVPPVAPTVYVIAKPFKAPPPTSFTEGVGAVTTPEIRWARCDLKTVSLLGNVLANQKAKAAGAYECLFIRDGNIVEASHSNVFAVLDGELWTHPLDNILPGITRQVILKHAAALGIKTREGHIPQSRFSDITELFTTATTTEAMPIVSVDGVPVGSGKVGPITAAIRDAWAGWVAAERAERAGVHTSTGAMAHA